MTRGYGDEGSNSRCSSLDCCCDRFDLPRATDTSGDDRSGDDGKYDNQQHSRTALTALALLWLSTAFLAAWLWRMGFQRANANLPESPWTDLWLPLAVISLGAVVAFFGIYVAQVRQARSHRD